MPSPDLPVPTPAPTGLPIEAVVASLAEALDTRGVAVLVAEPGAGKTTVAPLRLLASPWLGPDRIIVLEPRRVAARAAAARMASLLGESVGATVGLRTRDETRVGRATRLEVVTEGVLTRMLQSDPGLEGVGLVVFDEFHERSLHAELGLALALDVRRELRDDLRVLVASATLDTDRVAALLVPPGEPPAPVLFAPGRTHPVEVRWQPPAASPRRAGRGPEVPEAAVVAAVREVLATRGGDVLVFLPGAGSIRRVARLLEPAVGGGGRSGDRPVDVRPLFGALPVAEQDRALAPSPPGRRRVVLATDLAETSLTVEGVTAVVDAGLARVPRHDVRTGMTRLVTVPVARASADQRAGRAGRTGPGLAVRLWSAGDHAARRAHAEPAITQVDLTGLVLELALWGTTPHEAAFLDPPPASAVEHARRVLVQLGAIDDAGRPTARGRALGELPLHPRLARMVLVGDERGQGWTACLLAALLDERDPFGGRPDEVPTDLVQRLRLLDGPPEGGGGGGSTPPSADRAVLARVRTRARDLARRVGVRRGPVDPAAAGLLVATAYPDRVARARVDATGARMPGRFRLASGGGAWMAAHDELAGEAAVVAADLDGDRRDARIRLAVALDEEALVAASPVPVAERRRLVWDRSRDDLSEEVVRHLDGIELASRRVRPSPGPATTAALVAHVARSGLDALGWTAAGRATQHRLAFLHAHRPDDWPDVGDRALLATLDEWLAPMLPSATSRADLERVDPGALLVARLDHRARRHLDRLAPATLTLPSGRQVRLDYAEAVPVLAVAPQELFGSDRHPSVLDGEVPVVLHLLSPAGRPVQITSDLAGFWSGTWAEVRREMAGRYPKHPWPADPLTAEPRRRPSRRR